MTVGTFVLDVPDAAWEECGEVEPWTRLLTTVWICGTPHHLEALAVVGGRDGTVQRVVDPLFASSLDGMFAIYAGGPFYTSEIRGREYVINLTPFAD